MKDPLNRTKVVLRHLPASVPQQAIMDQIDSRFEGRYDWVQFYPGKNSTKHQKYSRVYINFKSSQDVVEFAEFFNGRLFVNEKGAQFRALVEYAPSQRVPKSNIKKDGREGTIEKDAEYLEFLEQISKPAENLPSAEIQLERKEAEKAVAGKEAPIVTPLMVFIRQKRAAKIAPQRTVGSITGRMVSSRQKGPVISSSPGSSKRGSERRRGSSTYVVKEGKEKPTYILASRREEKVSKDRAVVDSLVNNDNSTSSGALVGSSLEAGKGKIILLKSKGKEVSQPSDASSQQTTTLPAKPSPVKTVRSVLTKSDARGPPRQTNGDERYTDDRYSPAGDKLERSSRNSREKTGMWAPRQPGDVQSFADPTERVSILQHGPGNGERRTDVLRRDDVRSHGGGAKGNITLENGNQRNNNRRGPPRGAKEMEVSVSEGKHSKRGPSGFSAQEKQVWVQKSGSAT
ncbi:hypothetical protein LUZ60_004550 [Juncus effusus]|nr:hypothetical protein LUZ60_004550 [Juncus effusus]